MIRFILLTYVFCLAFTSCVSDEEIRPDSGGSPADSEARVSFSLMLSPGSQTQTRALSEADENAIYTVRLLLFREISGQMVYQFGMDRDSIRTVSPLQKVVETSLPAGTYDVVFLANAKDIINSCPVAPGYTKEEVLDALVETNTGKWKRNAIPMWGQIEGLTVNVETGVGRQNPVDMIRMMAKIDVEVDASAAADFTLTEILLYNASSRGSLAPNLINPAQPAQPAGAGGYGRMTAPLRYDAADGVTARECKRAIYVYEAPAGTGVGGTDNICLVIGGRYQGAVTTYYRVDFTGKSGGQSAFLPLLRNNYYPVKIVSVSGIGSSTPETALNTPPTHLRSGSINYN
ncbi:MAG: FimB/Mfa2 family fimbrial subunit [Tannerellaceae bacterium]|jgi:hypothetical protein|nr:FimB/Mfa2 family fimbrial subunit [Tannerellaceae bacterium]